MFFTKAIFNSKIEASKRRIVKKKNSRDKNEGENLITQKILKNILKNISLIYSKNLFKNYFVVFERINKIFRFFLSISFKKREKISNETKRKRE